MEQKQDAERYEARIARVNQKLSALAERIARDDQVLSPSYTRDYPLVMERGSGCTVEDVDGNVFLDFTAGIAVTATGHAHPEVVAAITDQAQKFLHMSGTDFYYAPEIELLSPIALQRVGSGRIAGVSALI